MNKLPQYDKDSKIVNISVINNENKLENAHREIELIYVIKGNLQVNLNNNNYQLNKSDFLLINSNKLHSIISNSDNLFVLLHFNYYELSLLLEQKNLMFSCNSSEKQHSFDQKLRLAIEELLSVFVQQRVDIQVEFLEKAYKLISILKNYLINRNQLEVKNSITSKGQSDRLTEIIEYIQTNYREPLSLDEVAGFHFLSSPYLSKIFKKQTGKTFSKYLNEIRLAHAVDDLLSSNETITRIALDNGFPNLAAFNRIFYEYYNMKPSEYRKKNSKLVKKEENQVTKELTKKSDKAEKELRDYLNTNTELNETSIDTPEFIKPEIVKVGESKTLYKYWNKLINLGYAKDILNSDMQEQVKLLQNDIGFKFARFWGIFSDDMHVEDEYDYTITYNFSSINKLIDFLLNNNIKPFIELGPKPKIISKSTEKTLIIQSCRERTLKEWTNLIRAFLHHCRERYGIEEVETWYFEIWNKHSDPLRTSNKENVNSNLQFSHSEFKDYFNLFHTLKENINEIVPSAKVGGCGLPMDLDDDRLSFFLEKWKLEELQPDFLSVYIYPIEVDWGNNRLPIKNMQSANPDFVKNKLVMIRKALKKAGLVDLELNITEWNISISNRDYLNDSCFKASYIVKNLVDNVNQHQINMVGYWLLSDIFSDFRDSKNVLHGGAGLLTKSGIKKPSYHAFSLMNQLGDSIVGKGKNYIITKKFDNRYQVLFFNYKHFNYAYYLHPEASAGVNEQYDIFEDAEPLNLSLEIQGVSDGKYRVKEIVQNRLHGSVLDEWLNFGAVSDMKRDEVEYLKQICTPYMKVTYTFVKKNSVVLHAQLQPHEVRLYELNLLIGE
ncbi:helix-turn-helix domain-containing protein [Gracilibacillus sp. YIM 98692]|uniref:GH39 family glycosyl hydrolase n=1 Tax=Gracilibacillus sp. YIM 98692 TaxID=2663532 RepID=UPI001F09083D|nr:helix-turn-helix domain-containing protein [Gracilibacillus sp. YIM 98692]